MSHLADDGQTVCHVNEWAALGLPHLCPDFGAILFSYHALKTLSSQFWTRILSQFLFLSYMDLCPYFWSYVATDNPADTF